ncbi:hypothetical protein [Streptomyces sp. NPDC057052]|uniref:hypothetical protein n=1 Tax=Streptomyces sp. NPDC057052 TaxID=3346010 RepID=UPI0036323FA6
MGRVYGCGCRCHLAAAVRALPDEHTTERFRYLILFHRPGERSRSERWTLSARGQPRPMAGTRPRPVPPTPCCVRCPDPSSSAPAADSSSESVTAREAFTGISASVSSAELSGTVTAESDSNKLLGRPHQYTSKITFDDTRIAAADVSGTDEGDVERGGAIEVFADAADAKARAEYIQSVTKSMPMLAEYDYVHGPVLVRVSHYLTPTQAAEYEAAVEALS